MADLLVPHINGGPLGPVRPENDSPSRIPESEKAKGPSFKEILDNKISNPTQAGVVVDAGELKFSKHAMDRIRSRGIGVNQDLVNILTKGFDLVKEKGGKDSLIMTEQGAFIVNVPSKTVVTVLGKNADQVFSNIDSAVIV